MDKKPNQKLVRESTREFIREARRTPGYTFFDWLHGYIYARWPFFYIGVATGTHPLGRKLSPIADRVIHMFSRKNGQNSKAGEKGADQEKRWTIADTYHGKVLPLESARQLISVKEEVRLKDLEKVIPYPRARDLILQHPDHIVVLDCPCRAGRENPCLPLDVCLIVGEPFASFVHEHHPNRSRWISQAEAVQILEEENARGHVHHAFFKDAMLLRYFAICNCCACCCGAMQAHQHDIPMLSSSGYVAKIDKSLCKDCEQCAETCQFGAISYPDGTQIDAMACMGCGVCETHCQASAISLVRSPEKGEPLEIFNLMEKAARSE
jgi:ferredoxin